ncbi:MAG: hypothetical protein A3A90_00820 [Candidatus Zambryskibacteria bacterium RIFCSPLOWO2_01_FULL_35_19]|uniref:Uncharacterized protein n=1 Tax=Candidatus Zambryskibacteria bacterium RIFCSPLOWO2_01_FULL_35_19 TaxID=1802757 RepID=A0A1G2TYT6_9BACT|nr:MAG: hypothetical protein A2726_00145 [Candidatus Zambryskibacteria bacterium RIFCSPHIGHO2_01_FULL_35_32]OHB02323.1 MAG: hypothetical protein A3A90_00820 [Candidatus Zambryskibacteria bacterium RIFCSPLOWO2_01_FULL_35_19]
MGIVESIFFVLTTLAVVFGAMGVAIWLGFRANGYGWKDNLLLPPTKKTLPQFLGELKKRL